MELHFDKLEELLRLSDCARIPKAYYLFFTFFFFFPPRWYITACKGQYFACFGMSSEFVPQLENKTFIIGSFLGFFSWRLLLVKTFCSWSVSVLLWNILNTLKSMKITCGLKDVCRKKPVWRSVPHADISGFILGFFWGFFGSKR